MYSRRRRIYCSEIFLRHAGMSAIPVPAVTAMPMANAASAIQPDCILADIAEATMTVSPDDKEMDHPMKSTWRRVRSRLIVILWALNKATLEHCNGPARNRTNHGTTLPCYKRIELGAP
jgi:hypothetical protein